MVKEISFGETYNSSTIIPSHFLRNGSGLTVTHFYGLKNVTTIETYFLGACTSLLEFSFEGLSLVTSIGANCLDGNYNMTSLDLSPLTNLTQILTSGFLNNCRALNTINIGSLDFNNIETVNPAFSSVMLNVPNETTSSIICSSQAIGNAFKAKFPQISNWTIVIQ